MWWTFWALILPITLLINFLFPVLLGSVCYLSNQPSWPLCSHSLYIYLNLLTDTTIIQKFTPSWGQKTKQRSASVPVFQGTTRQVKMHNHSIFKTRSITAPCHQQVTLGVWFTVLTVDAELRNGDDSQVDESAVVLSHWISAAHSFFKQSLVYVNFRLDSRVAKMLILWDIASLQLF